MSGGWSGAWRLARPAQWPILSAQLAVGVLLAAPAVHNGLGAWLDGLPPRVLVAGWCAWVVLLNGGTLAFNSAYDRDTGPVAYLQDPPLPPSGLAFVALAGMVLGAALGAIVVSPFFGLVTGSCVVLSVLYSHPAVRLKSRPGWDLAVNVLGYGAGTTLAGLALGAGGAPDPAGWAFAAGFGLLFGSLYPMTQAYQAADDAARGDRTLVTALGVRRSLLLAEILAWAALPLFVLGLHLGGRTWGAILPAAMVGLWARHAARWRHRSDGMTPADHEKGMYRALVLWAVLDGALALGWLAG